MASARPRGYSSASADLFCDGQAGMMGVAIDPQFASNRFIYVYSSSKLGGKLGNRVMRFKLNDAMTAFRIAPTSSLTSATSPRPPSIRSAAPGRTTAAEFDSAPPMAFST
jgi:hypothetical protein